MAGWKWGSRCLPTSAVQCPDWPIALDHHCRVLMREWYGSDVGNPRPGQVLSPVPLTVVNTVQSRKWSLLSAQFSELGLSERNPAKLHEWLKETGHNARVGTFAEPAQFGDLVVLSVNGRAAEDVIRLESPDLSHQRATFAT